MRRGLVFLVLLVLPACGNDNNGSSGLQIRSLPPPANAAIVFTSGAWAGSPGAPREHYFEGLAQLGELTDAERREWFAANDNHFVE